MLLNLICSFWQKEVPATKGFLPSPSRAWRQLHGCVCWWSALSSLFISLFIPICPPLDVSLCRSLKCAFVLSRDFFVEV